MLQCPNCKQKFDADKFKSKRVCASCKQIMGRYDKWFINSDGRIEHRVCENPKSYYTLEELAKRHEEWKKKVGILK